MRLAVIVGGWHFPMLYYSQLRGMDLPPDWTADFFCVAHRSPDLPVVREEKRERLLSLNGDRLQQLDRQLYAFFHSEVSLELDGWHYQLEPNTQGDWAFLNQWIASHDWRQYDAVLYSHDDNYLIRPDVVIDAMRIPDWLLLANGRYPESPTAYARGSFEFWMRELLEMLGGKIDLGSLSLTREGMIDTPDEFDALSAWNDTAVPLRDWFVRRGLADRVKYLSDYYRISPYVIEGERGWLHQQVGAPWSFAAGCEAYLW